MKTLTIGIQSTKGGVAKSTSTLALAAIWASEGRRVCVVDCDPWGTISAVMSLPVIAGRTTYELVTKRATLAECAQPAAEGFDVVAANATLDRAPLELQSGQPNWHLNLKMAIAKSKGTYDIVLLDASPNGGPLSVLVTAAANVVVIPSIVDAEAIRRAIESARRVLAFQGTEDEVGLNPDVQLAGLLLTFVEPRLRLTRALLEEVGGADVTILNPMVPKAVAVGEATATNQSIVAYAPDHPVTAAYRAIAAGLLAAYAEEEAAA